MFTKAGAVDSGKTLKASGCLCVSAYHKASGLILGYASRAQMSGVTFVADMAQFSHVNMNYWFYGLSAVTSFAGIANLVGVREMQYTFSNCSGLTSLDFRGFDPSTLTNLYLTFGSCSNLATIYTTRTLPGRCPRAGYPDRRRSTTATRSWAATEPHTRARGTTTRTCGSTRWGKLGT